MEQPHLEAGHVSAPKSPQSSASIDSLPAELLAHIIGYMGDDTVSLRMVNRKFYKLVTPHQADSRPLYTYEDASGQPYGSQYGRLMRTINGNPSDLSTDLTVEQVGLPDRENKANAAISDWCGRNKIPEMYIPEVSIKSFPNALFVHIKPKRLPTGGYGELPAKYLAKHLATMLSEEGPLTVTYRSGSRWMGSERPPYLSSQMKYNIAHVHFKNGFRRTTESDPTGVSGMPYGKQQLKLHNIIFNYDGKPSSLTVKLNVRSKHSPRALKRESSNAISDWRKEIRVDQESLPETAIKSSYHAVSVRIDPKRTDDGIATGPAQVLAWYITNRLAGKGPVTVKLHTGVKEEQIHDSVRVDFANGFRELEKPAESSDV